MGDSLPSRGGRERVVKVTAWFAVAVLATVVMVFAVIRVVTDVSNLTDGSLPPPGDFNRRYAQRPVLAYLHIVPGVVYLLGACLQLSTRFRNDDVVRHRRVGRAVLLSGALSGIFAVIVGIVMSFGGVVEAAATTVFGAWFLFSLASAHRAIRTGDVVRHRHWVIRAFAVGLGVGSIRVWVGTFEALGVLGFADGFGLAFWLGLGTHAIAAEWWLARRPEPTMPRPSRHGARGRRESARSRPRA